MNTINSKEDKESRTAVIYLRAASPSQDDQRSAARAQRAACRGEAERLGLVVSEELIDTGSAQ
jgi:hypothetical protein